MPKLPLSLLVSGVLVCAIALLFGYVAFPKILEGKIRENGKLVNGTDKWESWRVVPIPVFQKIYLFNVTNPKEVKQGGSPVVQELGPYVYQHRRTKVDISVHSESDTISYRHQDSYFFRPDLTVGSLTDIVTLPNIPYLGAVYKGIKAGKVARYFVSEIINEQFADEGLYMTRTVDEILFGGYFVDFIKELGDLKGETLLPNNTFGIYYGKNNSLSNVYEINAGVNDPDSFGQVVSYDNQTSMSVFPEQCGSIPPNAYDGSTMPPFLTRDREFYLFVPTLCRNMKFAYERDLDVSGIPAFKFSVPEDYLADVQHNPGNKCYCSDPEDEGTCLKGGVWDLGPCRQGAPMVMSFPHFYSADEEYQKQSVGLNPEEDKHQMVVVMEPTAAISLKVAIRVQMNIALQPTKYFPPLKKIPEMLHPVLWMDQGVTLPPQTLELIKAKLIRSQEIVQLATYVAFGVGCGLVLVGILLYWCAVNNEKKKGKKYSPTKKASLNHMDNGVNDKNHLHPHSKANGTYSKVPSHLSSKVVPEEEESFIHENLHARRNPSASPRAIPVSIPTVPTSSPVVTYVPSPTTKEKDAVVIAMHPKGNFPPEAEAMGASSNSMNRDLHEIDDTLQGINEALSSYENLQEHKKK